VNIGQNKDIKIFITWRIKKWSYGIRDIIIDCFGKNLVRIIKDHTDADVIITHVCDRKTYYNEKAINIIISSESNNRKYLPNSIYDLYITSTLCFDTNKQHIYLPFLYQSLLERRKSIMPCDYFNNKSKFCIYMYSDTHEHRIKYFKLLQTYKQVEAPAKCCNNVNLNICRFRRGFRNRNEKDINYLDEAVQLYTNYKFVLAIENTTEKGYFTEKIINPIIANSIPIYGGDAHVFNYINKKRVIYINDFKNDNELLKYIQKVDQSDELYNQIVKEPAFINNRTTKSILYQFKCKMNQYILNRKTIKRV
jgi:hypothetical protein